MKKSRFYLWLLFSFFTGTVHAQSVRSELYFTDPVKLPPNVNSDSTEVYLLFSRDSSNLYFVRQGHTHNKGIKENPYDQDIWFATKNKDGSYSDAKNFEKFNNKENNAVIGMSEDGNTVYLLNAYLKKGHVFEKGIAVSHKKGNHWTDPVKLEIPGLKIEGTFYGFYVNPQQTVIILSYDGPGSLGNEDLYVSTNVNNAGWTKPQSLGSKINTKGFEISPYLSEDTYTLFWSTDGRQGYGSADIYASFRTDETWTNWSEPVNMGDKINSKAFDAYFIMSANDAWFSSNRDTTGKDDIYHCHAIDPIPVEDTVHEEVVNVPAKEILTETSVRAFDKKKMEDIVPELPAYVEIKLFFARNSSYLEPEAIAVADSVIGLLKRYPNVVAEIHSHADKRASESYNIWLTQRRASRVLEYMVSKGIDRKRLTPNWYGKTQIALECDPCTEEQYRVSRRTVIKLSRIK